MRGQTFMFIFVFIFQLSCEGIQKKNSLTEDKVKGKVKILTLFDYGASEKFGKAQKEELLLKLTATYNNEGNIIEKNYSRTLSGEPYKKYRYEYDELGNRTEKNYNELGKLQSIQNDSYDKNGNLTETINYNAEGKKNFKIVFQYDKDGKELERICYDASEKIFYKYIFSYEENGKKMIEESIIPSSKARKLYTYDNNGNELEIQTIDATGNILFREVHQYDDFDKNNNWGKYLKINDGKVNLIRERRIEYYGEPNISSAISENTNTNLGDKFLGTYVFEKGEDDLYRIYKIVISKNEGDYLLTLYNGRNFDGEYKKTRVVGRLNGTSLEINNFAKYSLIENGSILIYNGLSGENENGREFLKQK